MRVTGFTITVPQSILPVSTLYAESKPYIIACDNGNVSVIRNYNLYNLLKLR